MRLGFHADDSGLAHGDEAGVSGGLPVATGLAGRMEEGLYHRNFGQVFSEILKKTGASCYQIHKFTGLDQGYLSRLRSGEKGDPSFQVIVRLCLALAHCSPQFSQYDAEKLFGSVGRSLQVRL
jgi:hypothetical protein